MRGRFAELIEVGGKTWFPRDLEEALCAQAGIREAAVVGLPDAGLGQRPVGYVTTDGSGFDPAGLKAAIAKSLPYDLASLSLINLPAFPMTPTGKIAKAELRERAMQNA
jgi:acyl-CoA synthetase (AMP-forming)/AMP-acid ligase II